MVVLLPPSDKKAPSQIRRRNRVLYEEQREIGFSRLPTRKTPFQQVVCNTVCTCTLASAHEYSACTSPGGFVERHIGLFQPFGDSKERIQNRTTNKLAISQRSSSKRKMHRMSRPRHILVDHNSYLTRQLLKETTLRLFAVFFPLLLSLMVFGKVDERDG